MDFIEELGVLFLEVRRIHQHDFAQLQSGTGAMNRPPETGLRQERQSAAMVDMGVGQENRLHRRGVKGKLAILRDRFVAVALKQPSIQKKGGSLGLQYMSRPGDLTRAAMETHFHPG